MATTRPRHVITETDQVSQALAAAARRWPEESIARTSGALTGVYGPNYLADLREEWPE